MATWNDVAEIARSLPETEELSGRDGIRQWRVRNKPVAWERPLRKADFEAFGDAAPDGPILGARVPDLVAKEALIADAPDIYFTTPHFDGYPAVLVLLERIPRDELEELVVEAWLAQAPKKLVREYLEAGG